MNLYFSPTTMIDGTKRRSFFERVPEAMMHHQAADVSGAIRALCVCRVSLEDRPMLDIAKETEELALSAARAKLREYESHDAAMKDMLTQFAKTINVDPAGKSAAKIIEACSKHCILQNKYINSCLTRSDIASLALVERENEVARLNAQMDNQAHNVRTAAKKEEAATRQAEDLRHQLAAARRELDAKKANRTVGERIAHQIFLQWSRGFDPAELAEQIDRIAGTKKRKKPKKARAKKPPARR